VIEIEGYQQLVWNPIENPSLPVGGPILTVVEYPGGSGRATERRRSERGRRTAPERFERVAKRPTNIVRRKRSPPGSADRAAAVMVAVAVAAWRRSLTLVVTCYDHPPCTLPCTGSAPRSSGVLYPALRPVQRLRRWFSGVVVSGSTPPPDGCLPAGR
jgi:hypothetical protein